ncbi:MAG: alanine--glyoxylate aminotransferase family protein [Deltaproteobacteria bacterium]|nr:alanine--glyoxylate aminotransferase family protein [Deltaproteobacteria bacterium]MCK5709799.1 alanine--glyoxylate aminotransferase family protein [Deltaproteobacteria bacterium]
MKKYVFTPGPVPVPSEVLIEMAKPIIHHRTAEFEEIFAEVREGLKYIYNTKQEVFILSASGTGAMEASVANTLSRGDKVLVVNSGKFGERWGKICRAYGVEVEEIMVDWGREVDPAVIEKALNDDPSIKAVLTQASETSTGVKHPIKEIAEITNKRDDVIQIVDGITGVGVFEIEFDNWGIDVLVGGSQKAFMLPPGLSFAAMSEKAWKFYESSYLPKFYFDFKPALKNAEKNTTTFTPAVTLIVGLAAVLKRFRAEGRENMHKRHARLALATREAMKAIGLEPFVQDTPSSALTIVTAPLEIGAAKVIAGLRDEFGITVAGGQDQAKGKIFRISHIGDIDKTDALSIIAAIESVLNQLGYEFNFGAATKKASEILTAD